MKKKYGLVPINGNCGPEEIHSDLSKDASVKKSEIFGAITTAYSEDLVMPLVIESLMDDGFIKTGNEEDEIKMNWDNPPKGIMLLNIFNEYANSPDMEEEENIGITLNVKGLVISEDLVGIKKCYEGISKRLLDKDSKKPIESFNQLIETFPRNQEEFEAVADSIRYICLKNANYIHLRGQYLVVCGWVS